MLRERRSDLRRVSRQQRGDGGDAERAAQLAKEVVQSRTLRQLFRRQLGEGDRRERDEHQSQPHATQYERPEEIAATALSRNARELPRRRRKDQRAGRDEQTWIESPRQSSNDEHRECRRDGP